MTINWQLVSSHSTCTHPFITAFIHSSLLPLPFSAHALILTQLGIMLFRNKWPFILTLSISCSVAEAISCLAAMSSDKTLDEERIWKKDKTPQLIFLPQVLPSPHNCPTFCNISHISSSAVCFLVQLNLLSYVSTTGWYNILRIGVLRNYGKIWIYFKNLILFSCFPPCFVPLRFVRKL